MNKANLIISKLKVLKNHQGIKKYFFNTSWLFAEKSLRILSGLFVGVWVARYLGPEQFGIFSYALAFTAIFAGIAKLGLDGIMVRELVNHPEKRDTYLGTAFWLKILGAFIVMGLMAAIVPFTSNDATTNLFIFIIAAGLVFQSFEVVEFYFQSQVLAKIVSICKVIQLALSSIIKIYLVLTEAELIWFVLVTAFDALSLAISFFIAYQLRKNPSFYKHFDLSIAKQLLKDSWPLIFVGVASMINMRMDQVMLGNMTSNEVVGNYAAAVRLAEFWLIIPAILGASIYPAIIAARKHSLERYKFRILTTVKIMSLFALPTAVGVTLLSDFIISILYGSAYSTAGLYLALYIWTGVPLVVLFVLNQVLMIEKLTIWTMYVTVFAIVSNVVLNLILIPIYQGVGAVSVTLVVAYCSQLITIYIIFKKTNIFRS